MAYLIGASAMTLGVLEGDSLIASFFVVARFLMTIMSRILLQ